MSAAKKSEIFDPSCTLCPRLASFLKEKRKEYPTYYNRPVPQFGDPNARLIIVGLAPGLHGANATGRPFTGDHAGIILYRTLHACGFSTRATSESADDGLKLLNCRITNSVKCVPPQNKPEPNEIRTCSRYLNAELKTLKPNTVLLALGTIAHQAVLTGFQLRAAEYRFAHAAEFHLPNGMTLLDSYHCSRYNTQTRRLTEEMFVAVLRRARELVDRDA